MTNYPQQEIDEAVELTRQYGSMKAASRESSRSFGWIQRRVAKVKAPKLKNAQGGEPLIPDGYRLKGTSTLYGPDGETKLEWVKTDADKERQMEMFLEVVDELTNGIPPANKVPLSFSFDRSKDMMPIYPIGDHHLGMLAWKKETGGDNYDIEIGEKLLQSAMDYLVKTTPASNQAAVIFMGDFMHYDSFEPVTPTSRNQLDADGRYPKMVRAAIRSMRYVIEAAARKHKHVNVIVEIGNHDLSSSVFLMEALRNVYEKNDRITIDTSPMHFHYLRFGKNLIMTHHGHGRAAKLPQLPLIMATDRPKDWGETEHRLILTGHVHHKQVMEFPGCEVESLQVLASPDAYAAQNGYRAKRSMKAMVMHKEYGEAMRVIVTPEMLK